jgi:hypothetical protein
MLKNIKLLITTMIFSMIFTGCTHSVYQIFDSKIYKDTFNNLFDSSKTYQDTLQYTQKADVINESNNVEAILNVTYLNPTSKDWDNSKIHSFVVGIYIVNTDESDYELTINNINKFKKTKINKDMNILGSIPMENKWAQYYLVQISKYDTKQVDKDNLTIKLSHATFRNTVTKFKTN